MQRCTSSRSLLLFLALAALVFGAGYLFLRSPSKSKPSETTEVAANDGTSPAAAAPAEDSVAQELSAAQHAQAPKPPAIVTTATRSAPPPSTVAAAPQPPRVEPSPYTRQLVAGLTSLDLTRGPITKEQADQWKQNLQTLTSQGSAALPAIRQFLEQNQELNFGSVPGGDQLGQTSLRSAMINAMAQIGGADAQALMLQTLQTTTLPSEVAQLAQHLEEQAPGQYRQETINAINEILALGEKGQLPAGWDVGPLFQALQKMGDPSSTAMLDQLQAQYKYYATISLAGLDNGAGVPSLIREAQDSGALGRRDFALQMLAQIATQYPDAAAALLDQAKSGNIPDAAWRKIATGLAGDQYQIGSPPAGDGGAMANIPGLKTYHIQSGNQNFYSVPVPPDAQSQRLDLINQLLAASPSPAAQSALQGARDTLVPKQ